MWLLWIVVGGALLWLGGDILVRGASALALRLRLTPTVVGLTVMALGTSLPELMVSVAAQLRDSPAFAFGNVVGSNLFNIALVLGLCTLIYPLPIPGSTVRLEYPVMLYVSGLIIIFCRSTEVIDRLEGAFLAGSLVLFVAYVVRVARHEVSQQEQESLREAVEDEVGSRIEPRNYPLYGPIVGVVVGCVFLHFGASWFVDGAQTLARILGMSDRFISITIAAPGTGAPELAATVVAVYRRKSELAVANVVGSNIFNILGILGVASLVKPLESGADPHILDWDLWWMLGISVLIGPFLFGRKLYRWQGAILLAVYLVYLSSLFAQRSASG